MQGFWLTREQNAVLLYKSQTQPRSDQKQYLESLGGSGSARELDAALSRARHDSTALENADRLIQSWNQERLAGARSVDRGVAQAVNFFVHLLMAGEFGPDDSRDGRSEAFLRNPHVVATGTYHCVRS